MGALPLADDGADGSGRLFDFFWFVNFFVLKYFYVYVYVVVQYLGVSV